MILLLTMDTFTAPIYFELALGVEREIESRQEYKYCMNILTNTTKRRIIIKQVYISLNTTKTTIGFRFSDGKHIRKQQQQKIN